MTSNEETIRSYFDACSNGTAADIARCFTSDAVVYDTNLAPFRGAIAIGEGWVKIRSKWGGARWTVDSCVESGHVAAIEWSMHGTDTETLRTFTFRGSEHYRFDNELIAEIRQYWTFDRTRLDTGLRAYTY
jgi:ketosteroid isomerase-like protein